jgi:hypothetical protein
MASATGLAQHVVLDAIMATGKDVAGMERGDAGHVWRGTCMMMSHMDACV